MKITSSKIKFIIVVALMIYTITIAILLLKLREKSWFPQRFQKSHLSEIKVLFDEEENEDMYDYVNNKDTKQNEEAFTENRETNFKKIGDIYVFSAYFDNRPTLKPQIRVITLKQSNSSQSIGCAFRYQNHWIRVYAERHEMSENHGRFYGGWMYFCDVPEQFIDQTSKELFSVEINVFNTNDLDTLMPLNITSKTFIDFSKTLLFGPFMDNIGLCIPPLFGDINLSMLLQFLELGKVQGITHFTFYLYQVKDSIRKILEHYQEKGDVTLVEWHLPSSISSREIWYNGQMLTIQDCLFRNMARTKYLGFLDLDEFIIPTEAYKLMDLIELYSKRLSTTNISAFSFQSAFFDPKQLPDPSQQLKILQLLKRNSKLSRVRTKLLTIPQNIFQLGIHHVSQAIDDTKKVIFVDADVAKIHHYRPCLINFEPDMTCHKDVSDKTILKYSGDLIQSYQTALKSTLHLFAPDNHKNPKR